jgi:hypothetical protein
VLESEQSQSLGVAAARARFYRCQAALLSLSLIAVLSQEVNCKTIKNRSCEIMKLFMMYVRTLSVAEMRPANLYSIER